TGATDDGGNPTASTGGTSSSTSTGTATTSTTGGTTSTSSTGGSTTGNWHGAVSARVTDAMLQSGYSAWNTAFTQTCSGGSAVGKKDAGSVVSEGIGYGMLLAVAFDDRTLFDGLWKYYGDHLDKNGLMNWATGVCDAPGNNMANAATDGDLDTAMSL